MKKLRYLFCDNSEFITYQGNDHSVLSWHLTCATECGHKVSPIIDAEKYRYVLYDYTESITYQDNDYFSLLCQSDYATESGHITSPIVDTFSTEKE